METNQHKTLLGLVFLIMLFLPTWANAITPQVSAGYWHTVGLKSDGTVVAVGNNDYGQCEVSSWTNIVQVSAGYWHTVGLKSDGTVFAVGRNNLGQCEVSSWTNIVQVSAGGWHTVGLKSDGTVVAVGNNGNGQCEVSSWTNIAQVSAGGWCTFVLKTDGTVNITDDWFAEDDILSWTNIEQVSIGALHAAGLKSDGTLVVAGTCRAGQCDVSSWTNIVQIYGGSDVTVGLKSDGTVIAAGWNEFGQCDVSSWTNITQVSTDGHRTVGLKSDGTVVAVGGNEYGECEVSSWNLGQTNLPTIAQTPMSGPPGTTFIEWGTGFTPNSIATLHFRKPDGTEYPTMSQSINTIGHFEITYEAPWDKPPGNYTWWAIDGVTGEKSNEITYVISEKGTSLNVQTINPQSDHDFYKNFFPIPKQENLISGGMTSSIIAADGQSRLLLRITADSPCHVTISEKDGNLIQNGGLSTLENYRNDDLSSSVSIQLEPYVGGYIGFAVYRAPDDFFIPGYSDRLTRAIALQIDSSCGQQTVDLILRRPPIMISHGLWSEPNREMEDFRNELWNRFSDHSGKNIDDYIRLNDCKLDNAASVDKGAMRTKNNIHYFLRNLRFGSDNVTATQVDYIGHSMGGLWGRLIVQKYGKEIFSYDEGYLHKLITLNTPHKGSFLADIGQYVIDNAGYLRIWGSKSGQDLLCSVSKKAGFSVCDGAIEDLTSYRSIENFEQITVPSHALTGNTPLNTSCALLNLSKYIPDPSAKSISLVLRTSEEILKKINPDYGCENWFDMFDIQLQSDYIVGFNSQKGGLSGEQTEEMDHWHMDSFTSAVNQRTFELLNKWSNDSVFSQTLPASYQVRTSLSRSALNSQIDFSSLSEDSDPSGEILFVSPASGQKVSPDDQVQIELSLSENLVLDYLLIFAKDSDPVELLAPPYTASITIPTTAYGDFEIFALGNDIDGDLYTASITLDVNDTAILEKVTMSPMHISMKPGEQFTIETNGIYSDGSIRNLNIRTTYVSSDDALLTTDSNGILQAVDIGKAYVLVTPEIGDSVIVEVDISEPYMDAGFTSDIKMGIAPLTVNFKNVSAGEFSGWEWDFGDGQLSNEIDPSHTFQTPGAYTVILRITNNDKEDIETTTITVSNEINPEIVMLTKTSLDTSIESGQNVIVYGTNAANYVRIESGAKAEMINFPGQNSIQFQSSSDLFTVSRSGTMVTFQGSDETILKIPATTDVQTISFNGEGSRVLQIHNGRVMLDDQEITSTAAAIDGNSVQPNIITIYFEGKVNSTGGYGYEVPTFNIGDEFWGTYNLDLSVSDSIPDDESVGNYFGAISSLNINVGTYKASSSEVCALQVGNDFQSIYDYYNLFLDSVSGSDVNGWTLKDFTLQLSDPTKSALFSDEIPKTPPKPEDYVSPNTYLQLGFENKSTGDSSSIVADFEQHYITNPVYNNCGAYVAPGVWKEFDCYNLAAIGKTTNDDPFTPSWRLIGGYWQWGRKGPDSSQWYDTNTEHFAHGPTGPGGSEANDGEISSWDQSYAPDDAWSGSFKTLNDPCPAGFRVPTHSQWQGVVDNNPQSIVGTWSSGWLDHANYTCALYFGNDLMLSAAGIRSSNIGSLAYRGSHGFYWSNTQTATECGGNLVFDNSDVRTSCYPPETGFSVRCIAE
jgi:uncharacterized protein (TIGR02145 family)